MGGVLSCSCNAGAMEILAQPSITEPSSTATGFLGVSGSTP